ncbi:MAG TPA: class I tRNA ligase family protein, partial [Longimicrobiales bacterium]|nr:class I tRNA ligase family protein [Longimicrobiales bacterium]
LHSTVRDHLGRKMSKSLGNGIAPLQVVELIGADALRYTVIAAAGVGTDVHLNPDDLEEAFSPGRNFANKLWNIGRFALLNLEGREVRRPAELGDALELSDRWILSRLGAAVEECEAALTAFRFHEYAATVYHFLWGDLADWYVELIKPRLQEDEDASEASRLAARSTLVAVLDGGLRLLHPIMPFVTEALWQRLPLPEREAESLVIAAWPEAAAGARDDEAEAAMGALIELIGTVRGLRSEYDVTPSQKIAVRLGNVGPALRAALAGEAQALARLARVEDVLLDGAAAGGEPGAHAVLRGGAELFVPLAGIIDLERERERLGKELDRLEGQLRATEGRLGNQAFVGKAPAEVVEREREKAASFRDQVERLSRKRAALG